MILTFKRGDFVFYADGRLVESEANERAWLQLIKECQVIEDEGDRGETDRAMRMCDLMIERGFLKPRHTEGDNDG